MLDELQRLNRRIDEAEQDQQPQRYADRFDKGRDGRIILYGDSGDGGDDDDDNDDQFFEARDCRSTTKTAEKTPTCCYKPTGSR